MDLRDHVRDIPDFPRPGIVFKDITPLLLDPDASAAALAWLVERARRHELDLVVGIEARGLIFGGALAHELGVGFAPARKQGKLPAERVSVEYELEYGVDALELHADAIGDGTRVVIHDDVIATGGTVEAIAGLVEQMGGEVAGVCFIIDLTFLGGRERLSRYPIYSLIEY